MLQPSGLAFAHGHRRGRGLDDRRRAACVHQGIVVAAAMGNPAQERDGVARGGALIEHDADDQDAGEARLPGAVVDLMQADAEPVLVHGRRGGR